MYKISTFFGFFFERSSGYLQDASLSKNTKKKRPMRKKKKETNQTLGREASGLEEREKGKGSVCWYFLFVLQDGNDTASVGRRGKSATNVR